MKAELLIIVNRIFKKATYTIGRLGFKGFDENANIIASVPFLCNTLEDKWSAFKNGAADKIPGKTAIPDGKYEVILQESPRFKRILPHLLDVPFYTAILIHRGNKAENTDGCLLVGMNDAQGWISNSAFYEGVLVDLIKQYKKCYIIIK